MKEILDYFKERAGKMPGVWYVYLIITLLLWFSTDKIDERLSTLAFISGLAVLLYFFSGKVDDLIFEPFFGLKRNRKYDKIRYIRNLDSLRIEAKNKIDPDHKGLDGIYESSKFILEGSDAWNGKIKLYLDLSKAARSFVLLFAIISVFDPFSETEFAEYPTIGFINEYSLVITFILLIPYYLFRYLHMISLYRKIKQASLSKYQLKLKDSNKEEEFIFYNKNIVRKKSLPLYFKEEIKELYEGQGKTSSEIAALLNTKKSRVEKQIKLFSQSKQA